jgi:transketolase
VVLTKAFGGTFLMFADYMRGAVRLAALMDIQTTFVWTHDSIGVGEDGPTHQPIEHFAALRAIPNLHVICPG